MRSGLFQRDLVILHLLYMILGASPGPALKESFFALGVASRSFRFAQLGENDRSLAGHGIDDLLFELWRLVPSCTGAPAEAPDHERIHLQLQALQPLGLPVFLFGRLVLTNRLAALDFCSERYEMNTFYSVWCSHPCSETRTMAAMIKLFRQRMGRCACLYLSSLSRLGMKVVIGVMVVMGFSMLGRSPSNLSNMTLV